MIIASRTQFHVERPWSQRPFSIQPGEGPSRGLLRDCDNRLRNRWIVCRAWPWPRHTQRDQNIFKYSQPSLLVPLSVCYKVLYYYDVMINEVTRDMGWAKHGLVQAPSIHLAGHLTTHQFSSSRTIEYSCCLESREPCLSILDRRMLK